MQRPETLVILSPGFPAHEGDTTWLPPQQVFVRSLKRTYPALKIVVLSLEYPADRATYKWFGVDVIAFGGKCRGKLFRLKNWMSVWRTLGELNKQNEIIGLLSLWFDECALIGHYFARKHSLKHFSWILGQDAKAGNKYFGLIKPKGEQLIALSDLVRREVCKNYGVEPQHTITTGIDVDMFNANETDRDIDILGAGSLIALKQYDIFIDAVRAVSRYLPNVRAVICGIGPEKDRLQQQIACYGLERNIELWYERPHPEVLELMQRSRVFLHPSAYEGFGAVLLEALYAGAHVISFVKPMDRSIDHHHVVSDAEEMNYKLFELLLEKQPDHSQVMVYPIQQVAAKVMRLFAQSDAATCSIRAAIASKERFAL